MAFSPFGGQLWHFFGVKFGYAYIYIFFFLCGQVKESFKLGKEENAESASSSGTGTSEGEKQQQEQSGPATEEQNTLFEKFKSSISSTKAFQSLKAAKPLEIARKGLDMVKDELRGTSSKKKHLEFTRPPPFTGERSTRTEMVVTQTKQSKWQKKWESLREKVSDLLCLVRLSHVFKVSC